MALCLAIRKRFNRYSAYGKRQTQRNQRRLWQRKLGEKQKVTEQEANESKSWTDFLSLVRELIAKQNCRLTKSQKIPILAQCHFQSYSIWLNQVEIWLMVWLHCSILYTVPVPFCCYRQAKILTSLSFTKQFTLQPFLHAWDQLRLPKWGVTKHETPKLIMVWNKSTESQYLSFHWGPIRSAGGRKVTQTQTHTHTHTHCNTLSSVI